MLRVRQFAAVAFDQALMHTYVVGSNGTGKSSLLASMARDVMEAGHGLILMETEGNLYQSVLDYIPKDRIDDVVLCNVEDQSADVRDRMVDAARTVGVLGPA